MTKQLKYVVIPAIILGGCGIIAALVTGGFGLLKPPPFQSTSSMISASNTSGNVLQNNGAVSSLISQQTVNNNSGSTNNLAYNISGGNNQFGNSNTQIINPEVTNELRHLQEQTDQVLSARFRPLNADLRAQLVNDLSILKKQYGTNQVKVWFRSTTHDKNTMLLEDEWSKIVTDSGMGVMFSYEAQFYSGRAPDLIIRFQPADIKLAESFCGTMQQLVNIPFLAATNGFDMGMLAITINAVPEYRSNGVAILR